MGCDSCNSNSSSYNPLDSNSCSCGSSDSANILYTGPNLTCIGVSTNTNLQVILQMLDTQVCSIIGDYSSYNTACLSPTTTQQEFVETISSFVCDLQDQITNVVNDTIPGAIVPIQAQIDDIINPGLISPCINISYTPSSTLNQILASLSNSICNLYSTTFDLGTVDWDQCFSVSSTPITIAEGFNLLVDQICTVQASINSGTAFLPTFNNTGSCLASPSSDDTLVATINKIKARLCLTPTFNPANLDSSTCVSFNSSSTLEAVIEAQNATIDAVSSTSIRSVNTTQFSLLPIDSGNPCLGQQLTLNTTNLDRKVALDTSDLTPGTLFDKIAQGTNITLDFGTINPGKLTISSTGGVLADEKFKINAGDPTPGYFVNKVLGSSNSYIDVTIVPISTTQVELRATLNLSNVISAIFDEIEGNTELSSRFCSLINSCPSPCDAPSNVQVTFIP